LHLPGTTAGDYKEVTVTVNWQDAKGETQSAALSGTIAAVAPTEAVLSSRNFGNQPGPQVRYTPGDAPQIISVDTGAGGRETSKPLPDVKHVGDYAHEVRFDVINYHRQGDFQIVDRREEFVTVNCLCTLRVGGPSRTPARARLTGTVLRDLPGVMTGMDRGSPTKEFSGTVRTSGDNPKVASQPELCGICCRDHHDGPLIDGDPNRYNPADGEDHRHYYWNGDDYVEANADGMPYDEACRLKRINGIFQVFEDWNLVAINAIPESYLAGSTVDYTNYVADVVRSYVGNSPAPASPDFPDVALAPGKSRQIQGRAIYIDYMTADQKSAAANLEPSTILNSVPWYEVNLTSLARWKLQPVGSDAPVDEARCRFSEISKSPMKDAVACITSEEIQSEALQQDNYSRGLVIGGGRYGSTDAQVYVKQGNVGLIDRPALTRTASLASPVLDEVTVTNSPGANVGGTVQKRDINNPAGDPWKGNNPVQCTYREDNGPITPCGVWTSGNQKNEPRTFSFEAVAGASVEVTVSYPGGVVCPGSRTVTAPETGLIFTLQSSGTSCGTP
jgi:hypothetical protein